MIRSDKILDVKDKINSLEYFLDNEELGDITIDCEKVVSTLNILSEELFKKTNLLSKCSSVDKVSKSEDLNTIIKGKVTNYLSLLFKIELLKDRMKNLDNIKVSKYVSDFIENV